MRGETLRRLSVVLLLGALGTAGATRGQAATAPPHHSVVLTVDNTLVSATLTPAQALKRAQHYAAFTLRAPRRVPRGVVLQGITISSFGGNFAFATVALDYAGPGSRAFSLSESKVHVSTNNGKGGKTARVRIGKTTGTLVETKSARVHAFDLSWFSATGYDVRTLGADTRLTRNDLLRVATSI